MAEITKEQAKNSEIRRKNTEQTLESEKGITTEKVKQSQFDEQELQTGIDYADVLAKIKKEKFDVNSQNRKDISEQILINKQAQDDAEKAAKRGNSIAQNYLKKLQEEGEILQDKADISDDIIAKDEKELELLEKSELKIRNAADAAKNLGDKVEGFFESIGGKNLTKALGIENFGTTLKNEVTEKIMDVDSETGKLGKGFGVVNKQVGGLAKRLMALVIANPITALVAAAVGLVMMFRKLGRAQRELANELSFSKDQLDGQLVNLKLQEARFKVLNLDASQLKGTLTTLSEEFRDLSLVTAENAANIEQFAQNAGIGGSEVAKLNKKLMVMEGLSFDAALSMQRQAAAMAKAEGLAVGRVLNDMASAAEDFARFSRDGADGLAEAAVAAAKLGLSLDGVLKASEGLLDFESSITKEFEAQVLTGQALNLERARQAALAGDQEGLLQEIRSIAMGVNVESMNVVQKDAIAGAIGISVADLMRVSRGESLDKQQTQIDLQKETNDILLNGFQDNTDELKNIEENTKQGGATANNLTGVQFEVST